MSKNSGPLGVRERTTGGSFFSIYNKVHAFQEGRVSRAGSRGRRSSRRRRILPGNPSDVRARAVHWPGALGTPEAAQSAGSRRPPQKAATFSRDFKAYLKKILSCNNSEAMLRFCYTSPKPVDADKKMGYSMGTGKGSYTPMRGKIPALSLDVCRTWTEDFPASELCKEEFQ